MRKYLKCSILYRIGQYNMVVHKIWYKCGAHFIFRFKINALHHLNTQPKQMTHLNKKPSLQNL